MRFIVEQGPRRPLLFTLCVLAALALGLSDEQGTDPIPVILVADVGVDDAGAVLYALSSKRLNVLGIASSFGCHQDVHVTASNARRLLAAANRSDIEVYLGSRWPLGTTAPVLQDGSAFHGADGLGGHTTQSDHAAASEEPWPSLSAAEFIAAEARARPGELVVLCFSPLTNVALAGLLEPRLPQLLRALVVMGGSVYRPGNAAPLAEANFHHDSLAARTVVRIFGERGATAPLVLAPLDLTHDAMFGPDTIKTVAELGGAARLFAEAWPVYQSAYCTWGGLCDGAPLHDAHPVAWLLEPALYTKTAEMLMDVRVGPPGDPTDGMCLVDQRRTPTGSAGSRVLVLLDVDEARFVNTFLESVKTLAAAAPSSVHAEL